MIDVESRMLHEELELPSLRRAILVFKKVGAAQVVWEFIPTSIALTFPTILNCCVKMCHSQSHARKVVGFDEIVEAGQKSPFLSLSLAGVQHFLALSDDIFPLISSFLLPFLAVYH